MSLQPVPNREEHAKHETLLVTAEDAALMLGIGRTSMYDLINSGEIKPIRIGRLRRIAVTTLRSYVDRLIEESNATPSLDRR